MLDLLQQVSLIIPELLEKLQEGWGFWQSYLEMAFAGLFSALLVYVGRQVKKSYYEYMQKTVGTAGNCFSDVIL